MQTHFMQQARALEAEAIAWRRKMHENPEVAFEEVETADFIEGKLREFGYIPHRVGRTGLVAVLEGSKAQGKTIGLRADIDALPIQEKTGLPFASQRGGVMHACGHDMHTAILLGVAKMLSFHKSSIPGRIKFLFQPAEETLSGAAGFVQAGELDDLDGIAGLHILPTLETGTVGVRKGPLMAAVDTLTVTITGRSCHGAYPHLGVDAVVIAAHLVTALQTVVSRNAPALDSVVLSFGAINGGTAANIIADAVTLQGTLRTLHVETRKMVIERIRETVHGVAAALGGEATLELSAGIPPLISDDVWVDRFEKAALQCIPEDRFVILPNPVMGGEDFSLMLEKVPGVYWRLGARARGEALTAPHSPTFVADEGAIVYGMGITATLAVDYLLGEGSA